MKRLSRQILAAVKLLTLSSLLLIPAMQPVQANTDQGQGKGRTIKFTKHVNQPLELIDVRLAERSVRDRMSVKHSSRVAEVSEVAFDSDDEWLKNIKFNVRNVSGKAITRIESEFEIRHPSLDSPLIVPIVPRLHVGGGAAGAKSLAPGDELSLALSDHYYRQTLDFLKSKGADSAVRTVLFDVGFIRFDDGTAWSNGVTLRRDPNNPNQWIRLQELTSDRANDQGGTFTPVSFKPAGKLAAQSWGLQ